MKNKYILIGLIAIVMAVVACNPESEGTATPAPTETAAPALSTVAADPTAEPIPTQITDPTAEPPTDPPAEPTVDPGDSGSYPAPPEEPPAGGEYPPPAPSEPVPPSGYPPAAPESDTVIDGYPGQPEIDGEGDANVTFVRASAGDDGSWTFTVTVEHEDTGWEDYADGWDVITTENQVLKPDLDSPFTRLLLHPHENEQPFTRSQSGIIIPTNITVVFVRAHDLVDGWGGQTVRVDLNQTEGENFVIER